jgi:hypothetical protein
LKEVYLFRTTTSNQGTEGILATDGFFCRTLELPWRNNKQNISCIPSGEYIVKIRKSNKFGTVYWINSVPNRSWILIHSGNLAGDVSKGFKTNVEGCILLGKKQGFLYGQRAVLISRPTVRAFMEFMKYKEFKLTIIGGDKE